MLGTEAGATDRDLQGKLQVIQNLRSICKVLLGSFQWGWVIIWVSSVYRLI